MNHVYDLFVLTHLLGMAAVVGGYLVFASQRADVANQVMVWGARIQFLTGLILVGIAEMTAKASLGPEFHAKIGVKLLIALAVVALVEISCAKFRKQSPAPLLVHIAGGLAILNVFIAVLWQLG